jgi:hypothetical protein
MDMAFPDSLALDSHDVAVAMRPLGWSELCARLVAAQDLRRLQARANVSGARGTDASPPAGSFHGAAAHMLEHHSVKGFINLTSSVYRKGNQGTSVDSRENPLIERAQRQADENCHD